MALFRKPSPTYQPVSPARESSDSTVPRVMPLRPEPEPANPAAARLPARMQPVYPDEPRPVEAVEVSSNTSKETPMDKPLPAVKPAHEEKRDLTSAISAQSGRSGAQDTIISPDTHIEGKIHSKSELRIQGSFKGEIVSSDKVVVGTGGRVEATIESKSMTISGRVVGNLRISERLEILATGEMFGDLETQPGALIIEKGARIEGRLSMGLSMGQNPPEKQG